MHHELLELGDRILKCRTVTPRIKINFPNGNTLLCNGLVIRAYMKTGEEMVKITTLIADLPVLTREYLFSCLRCWFMSADSFFDLPEVPEA